MNSNTKNYSILSSFALTLSLSACDTTDSGMTDDSTHPHRQAEPQDPFSSPLMLSEDEQAETLDEVEGLVHSNAEDSEESSPALIDESDAIKDQAASESEIPVEHERTIVRPDSEEEIDADDEVAQTDGSHLEVSDSIDHETSELEDILAEDDEADRVQADLPTLRWDSESEQTQDNLDETVDFAQEEEDTNSLAAFTYAANRVQRRTLCSNWTKQYRGGFFGKTHYTSGLVHVPAGYKLERSRIQTRSRVKHPRVSWVKRPSKNSTGAEFFELQIKLHGGFKSAKVSTRACFDVVPHRSPKKGKVLDTFRVSLGSKTALKTNIRATIFRDGALEGTFSAENHYVFASYYASMKIILTSNDGRIIGESSELKGLMGACWFSCPSRINKSFRFDFSRGMKRVNPDEGINVMVVTGEQFTSKAAMDLWANRDAILATGKAVIGIVKMISAG